MNLPLGSSSNKWQKILRGMLIHVKTSKQESSKKSLHPLSHISVQSFLHHKTYKWTSGRRGDIFSLCKMKKKHIINALLSVFIFNCWICSFIPEKSNHIINVTTTSLTAFRLMTGDLLLWIYTMTGEKAVTENVLLHVFTFLNWSRNDNSDDLWV